MRSCGDCQLCCRLVPVREIGKVAGQRCRHQKFKKGCAVYGAGMPLSCSAWSCGWLVDPDAAGLGRPDRSHYVVDAMLDYVTAVDNATGAEQKLPVVQVWIDPSHPDAHRDPALRSYLESKNAPALVRYGNVRATLLLPPSWTVEGRWREVDAGLGREAEHTAAEIAAALGD